MDNFANANSPTKYFGPFNASRSLGIDRAHYVALEADDPAAAARFAVDPPPPIIKPRQDTAAPKPAEKRPDQIFTF